MSYWRKSVALLTLVFFANTGFAVVCDLKCAMFGYQPAHQAMTLKASASSANHHSGHHHSRPSSSGSSTAVASVSMGSSQCEHLVEVTSQFKLAPEKSAADVIITARSTLDPILDGADTGRVQNVESPPSLSNVPVQISLRI